MTAPRLSLVIALAVVPQLALAAPKKKDARAQFDKGVAAYTKGDFQKASDALAKSFALEADEETLFAWAQTERKLGHCDKAVELYGKLLTMNLPAANKEAIQVQVKECKQILDEERAAAAVVDTPAPAKDTPAKDAPSKDTPSGDAPAKETAATDMPASDGDQIGSPPVDESPSPRADTARAWWKDPVGGALVGVGVVGVALGTVFLIQGSSADSDAASATTYDEFETLSDRAESRGRLGVIGLVAGGALITGGVIWYATHKSSSERTQTVSGWLAPSAGGLVLSGRF